MRVLFADSSFLVARYNPEDRHFADVKRSLADEKVLGDPKMRWVLSDYVFDETLTTILEITRSPAAATSVGEALRGSSAFRWVRVDETAFEEAWDLFRARRDKLWSFTDCTSFVLMRRLGITQALSFDANFRQAGFETLP